MLDEARWPGLASVARRRWPEHTITRPPKAAHPFRTMSLEEMPGRRALFLSAARHKGETLEKVRVLLVLDQRPGERRHELARIAFAQ
jgi:hypothetical protein